MGSETVTLLGSLGASLVTEGLATGAAVAETAIAEEPADLQTEKSRLAELLQGGTRISANAVSRHQSLAAKVGLRMTQEGDGDFAKPFSKAALKRAVAKEKRKMRFRYGTLGSDHPVQIYVDELARRIPVQNNFKVKFVVLPDWREPNAASLPDGTIFLSFGLLQSAGTEEALLGVMAHEYAHAFRKHQRKTFSVQGDDFLKRALQMLGMARFHELEADLRDAVRILNGMKISPIPFKQFFLGLYEKEKKRDGGGGIVHGSSLDRATNIATVVYLFDLEGISNTDWKKIPAELLQSPHQTGKTTSNSSIIHHPRFSLLEREQKNEAKVEAGRKARCNRIEALSPQELPEAIAALWKNKKEPADAEVFEKACGRFEKEAGITATTLKAHLWLFCNVNPLEEGSKNPPSAEEVASFRNVFENLKPSKFLNVAGRTTHEILWDLLPFALEQGFFENPSNHRFDPERFERFVGGWSKTLAKVSRRFDSVSIYSEDQFIETVFFPDYVNDLAKRYPDAPRLIKDLPLFQKSSSVLATAVRGIGKEIVSIPFDKRRLKERIRRGAARILKTAGQTDLKTWVETVLAVGNEALDALTEYRYQARVKGMAEDESSQLFSEMETGLYVVYSLLKYGLANLKSCSSLSDFEKELIVTAAGNEHVKEWSAVAEPEIEESKTFPFYSEIVSLFHGDRLYRETTTAERVEQLYFYLLNKEFRKKRLGLEEKTPNGTEIVATYASAFFYRLSLKEIMKHLAVWKEKGIDIESVLDGQPQLLGILQGKLAEAVMKDRLGQFDLISLLKMSGWIANPNVRALFQRYVRDRFWDGLSFDQKLDLVFPKGGERGVMDGLSRQRFIEEEIKTAAQFRRAKERIEENLDFLSARGSVEAGLAVLLDINMRHRDVTAFLNGLLLSQRNDDRLKELIFEFIADLRQHHEQDTPNDVVQDIEAAEALLRFLYTADPLAKGLLLRKLLVGDGGGLTVPEKRRPLFAMLFGEWVVAEPSQKDLTLLLGQVKEALVASKEWELLYFALQSVLLDQMAIPPPQGETTRWGEIELVQNDLDRVGGSPELLEGALIIPPEAYLRPRKHQKALLRGGEQFLHWALDKKGVTTPPAREKMTPLRFVREVASHMGALGVRFTQQLPLITELSPEYEAEFAAIYDKVQGQSKLAALTLLEREWSEVWETIAEVGKSVGGGSVVTVYEATGKDGSEEIIKVRNPNILYHLEEVYRFACEILDFLAAHNNNRATYQAARLLLDDIYAWVKADINFEGFLEQDRKFKVWTEDLDLAVGRYRLVVPKSKGPANPFFAREEKISGTNLTDWEKLVAEGHDMKAVIRLLVRYYVAQIAEGQVLSDIHIGNNAVTADGRIAVYDRNFYLHLSDEEKRLALLFLNPASDTAELEEAFCRYIGTEDRAVVESLKKQDWLAAQKALIRLRQQGVQMPLHFTLILKNFQALQRMAKKAGFENLFEAFGYNP